MRYRKFAADNIFTGYELLDHKAALITDMEGRTVAITDRADAGEDIEVFEGVLSPGFVNCHCHLELSHMKEAVPRNSGMVPFLLSVMGNRYTDRSLILSAIEKAETEMYDRGIAAVGDICNTADTLEYKQNSRLYYHNFIETSGFVDQTAGLRFDQSMKLYEQFREQPVSLVPHAPYSVSGTLFKLIANLSGNRLLTMHNQESQAENQLFVDGGGAFLDLYKSLGIDISGFGPTGVSSLQSCLQGFHRSQTMILVHDTETSEQDLEWINQRAGQSDMPYCYWCLCPNANLYINGRLPDIRLLQRFQCKIVVGTDSLASNSALDILEELKTIQLYHPGLSAAELLRWATINGAEALGIQQAYGSFEPGKKPGITLISNMRQADILEGATARRLL